MKFFKSKRLKNLFNSLRGQLIIYYMVVSLIVLSVGLFFMYKSISGILQKQNEEYVLQQFKQAENNIYNLMDDIDRVSTIFFIDDKIQDFLRTSYSPSKYETVEMLRNVTSKIYDIISSYNYINSIYLFTNDGDEFGGSLQRTVVNLGKDKKHEFYSSDIYKGIGSSKSKILWQGGVKENFYNEYIVQNPRDLISAVREVKPINEPHRNGILILNIDERNLASIYSSSLNTKDSFMYILDDNGKVVSSSSGTNIGVIKFGMSQIDKSKDYGSFMLEDNNSSKQIVYYKLKRTNWIIVREIPLSLFSNDIRSLQSAIIIFFLLGMLVIFITSVIWLRKITEPLNNLAKAMRDVTKGHLGITLSKVPNDELGFVVNRFNSMSISIAELIRKNEESEKEKRALEIEALQSQINPHFLYNTLNMIKWMAAVIKAKNIVDSIVALGNILRPVFSSSDTICRLQEEIDYVDNYIKIMNWRFGNMINVVFNVPESCKEFKIPRFILQPVIENSITHGMKDKSDESIDIRIDVFEEENDLVIKVSDTGMGISKEKVEEINHNLTEGISTEFKPSRKNIGLINVHRRIGLNFGLKYGIKIESSEGVGTKVFMSMPKTSA